MDSDLPEWVRKAAAEVTAERKARWQEGTREEVERAANAAADAGRTSVTVDTGIYCTEADQQAAQQVVEDLRLPSGFKAAVRVVDDTIVSATIFGSQLSRTGTTSRPVRKVHINVEREDKQ